MYTLLRIISFVGAHVAVWTILLGTLFLVQNASLIRRIIHVQVCHRSVGHLHMLLTGTFHSENWFRAHIVPLSLTHALERIYVVTDQPLFKVDKVVYLCPPSWALRILGRTISRWVTVMSSAWRYHPDLLMGYHIMPNAIICLIASALFGGNSIYQMTGGPIQIIGGGVGSENALLRRLKRPSILLEMILFHIVRQFDLTVVRGSTARQYVERRKLGRLSMVVTGGIDTQHFRPDSVAKEYDLVYISRLVPGKGLEPFLRIVAAISKRYSDLKVAVVGDGPLKDSLEEYACSLGIAGNVVFLGQLSNVVTVLQRSRIFVLTSRSEGMSIALLEAMSSGLPAAVADVGDLRDVIESGYNGIYIDPNRPEYSTQLIHDLLVDAEQIEAMSITARRVIEHEFSIQAVARRWDRYFVEKHGYSNDLRKELIPR